MLKETVAMQTDGLAIFGLRWQYRSPPREVLKVMCFVLQTPTSVAGKGLKKEERGRRRKKERERGSPETAAAPPPPSVVVAAAAPSNFQMH